MNSSQNKSICVLPWISQHVSTRGNIAPCCEYDGSLGHLSNKTLEEAWQGSATQELRRKFLNGEIVEGCWKCFDREKNEGQSFRLDSNARFQHWEKKIGEGDESSIIGAETPVAIDFRFSNLCNFKCRSCWHGSSSKWFMDGRAIGVTVGDKAEIRSFNNSDDATKQIEPYLSKLEEVYFAGGEALMTADHYNVLSLLIKQKRTDVRLRYTSNMSITMFNGQSIFDLWQHFENVDVEASVDASGSRGALIRKGFRWETFVTNLAELRRKCPHVDIKFGITVSAFNILSLPILFEALREKCDTKLTDIHMHSLQDPIFYRTQILPQSIKRKVSKAFSEYVSELRNSDDITLNDVDHLEQKLKKIEKYMHAQDLQEHIEKFQSISRQLDGLRSERCDQTFPELKELWTYKPPLWRRGLSALRAATKSGILVLRR